MPSLTQPKLDWDGFIKKLKAAADDYSQVASNERFKEKINGLLGGFGGNIDKGFSADNARAAGEMAAMLPNPAGDASSAILAADDIRKGNYLSAALNGIGVLPYVPALGGAIKAYHGSPHKFDAFDMSKIGTGEGAQAYGHGLYFAESPEVAKTYLNEGLNAARTGYIDNLPDAVQMSIYKALQTTPGEVRAARISKIKNDYPDYAETVDKAINDNSGNLYNVSLEWPDAAREAADPLGPQHFLDWDKPLSEQPGSIIDALSSIGIKDKKKSLPYKLENDGDQFNIIDGETSSYLPVSYSTEDEATKAMANLQKQRDDNFEAWKRRGFEVYNNVKDITKDYTGQKAAQLLQEIGIPGIRYLDGGSRGAGNGSYNYVIFDDKIPRIVERNGKGLLGEPK